MTKTDTRKVSKWVTLFRANIHSFIHSFERGVSHVAPWARHHRPLLHQQGVTTREGLIMGGGSPPSTICVSGQDKAYPACADGTALPHVTGMQHDET